jgi:hypothetical protein
MAAFTSTTIPIGSCSRDLIGYEDGINLYQNYFENWGVDPTGTICSTANCIDRCRSLPEVEVSGGIGGATGVHHPRQECMDRCEGAAARFWEWFYRWNNNNNWHANLPDCPCNISCTKRGVVCTGDFSSYEYEYETVCAPSGFSLGWGITYPFYLQKYHPGACYDLRGIGVPRTQCTYDCSGKLITEGPGIGTVDYENIPGGHLPYDVDVVDEIIELEGGTLREGCWFELYKRLRPLKNGNNCEKNPR